MTRLRQGFRLRPPRRTTADEAAGRLSLVRAPKTKGGFRRLSFVPDFRLLSTRSPLAFAEDPSCPGVARCFQLGELSSSSVGPRPVAGALREVSAGFGKPR